MNITTQYNQHNLFNLHNRIDSLINDYSKLLVIRIDFGIQQAMGMEVHSSFMKEAFTRLRNNMRNQPLFNHLVSYVAKLEYTPDKSWHYHVIFFFNDFNKITDFKPMIFTKLLGKSDLKSATYFPKFNHWLPSPIFYALKHPDTKFII